MPSIWPEAPPFPSEVEEEEELVVSTPFRHLSLVEILTQVPSLTWVMGGVGVAWAEVAVITVVGLSLPQRRR